MEILVFLKTIADMFYALSILDYALMAIVTIVFVLSINRIQSFHIEDFFAFSFMFLLYFTLMRAGSGFKHFVKMFSAFMAYFIGRGYFSRVYKAEKALVLANYIVVGTNVILFLLGIGFITWGNANTFRGMYFYKTDFSIAMIYAVSAFMFLDNPMILLALIEWLIIAFLILRSNTRAALLIFVLVFGIWILYRVERKREKPLKVDFKLIAAVVALLIVALFLVVSVLSLPVFKQFHFISFNFSSFGDLLNASNTQGRNVIWNNLLTNYRNANWFQKALGIDFISDGWSGFDAHNAYLKILFSTGYVGLITFVGFIIAYIVRLNKLKNRSLFYYNLSILLTFLLQSMSQSSIDFTQMTWIFLFFAGCAVSESYYNRSKIYYFNRDHKLAIKLRRRLIIRLPSFPGELEI